MPNKTGYRFRSLAKNDLEEIWLYTSQAWGLEQADRYLGSLLDRISWLAKNPLSGRQRNDIKAGYRCYPEGRHLIFYMIDHHRIDVIGIVHQSMDVDSHLDEN